MSRKRFSTEQFIHRPRDVLTRLPATPFSQIDHLLPDR